MPDTMFRSSIIVQLLTLALVVGSPLNLTESKRETIDKIVDASIDYITHIIDSQMMRPEFNLQDLEMRLTLTFLDLMEMLPWSKNEGTAKDAQSEAETTLRKFQVHEVILPYIDDTLELFGSFMKRLFKAEMKNPDFKMQSVHDTLTKTFKNFFDMVSLQVDEKPKERALDVPKEEQRALDVPKEEQQVESKINFKDPLELLFLVVKGIAGVSLEFVYGIAIPFLGKFENVVKDYFVQFVRAMMDFQGDAIYFYLYEIVQVLLDWENPENAIKKLYGKIAEYVRDELEGNDQQTIKTIMEFTLNLSTNISAVLGDMVKLISVNPFPKTEKS